MHTCNQINRELCVWINKQKSSMIFKNKTWKIKRQMSIKIFNFERWDIYPVVFAKFIC